MRLALIAGIVIGLLAVVSSNSENSNEELRKRLEYMMEVEANNTARFHKKLEDLKLELMECQEMKNMPYMEVE